MREREREREREQQMIFVISASQAVRKSRVVGVVKKNSLSQYLS